MKNDIDSILNALFSGGKLQAGENTRSRAAQEAEAFLENLEKTKKSKYMQEVIRLLTAVF